ncbi:MAG: YfhO family protein [Anaerolineae bacterium]|nr:YfhO family protein [Anaerolineae bacterium]
MMRFSRFLPLLGLIVLAFFFFWKLAFTDMILARGDTYNYFYPYWDVRNAAFRAGELPLWTPNIFMGAPLLANPQLGTFYPPNWLMIPFRAPDAIRYSILIHIIWAATGAFVLFRQTIIKSLVPSLLAASVFALSGYLGAHAEQINQLQGLSWMPWLFYFFYQAMTGQRRTLWTGLLAVGLALQIFSGHTQTVFITGVGLGIFAVAYGVGEHGNAPLQKFHSMGIALITLLLASIVALLLAIPQILPTLELTGMSNRGGGFTAQQATAFSLPPTYLGRALLPSYDGQLFGEYIGYIGVIALGLALVGSITPINIIPSQLVGEHGNAPNSNHSKHTRIIWIGIAIVGLTFAIGRFNPFYWQIASLPGFNLFRVPARWLSLFVLAMSMLSGIGLHMILTQRIDYKRLTVVGLSLIGLMLIGRFSEVAQVDIVGSAVPTRTTLFMWSLGLIMFIASAVGIPYIVSFNPIKVKQWLGVFVVLLVILELFLASRILPYNDLTPRDVYEGQRFTISQLLAYNDEQTPSGRVLSISQRFFDPGDNARLRERYQQMGMDEEAIQTAFTAVKRQETLFPNLSLTWGIPSIDGFGGGVLPTIYYSQFTSLLLPENTPRTVDGRLGEILALPECRGACIPDLRWLTMTDTRYLITDKVYDIWYEGVAYDTSLAQFWQQQQDFSISGSTDFVYDEIRVLHIEPLAIENNSVSTINDDIFVSVVTFDELANLLREGTSSILAMTVVDTRTDDFLQVVPDGWQRLLSSDIKIYENLSASRAYFAENSQILPDDWQGHEDALTLLQNCLDCTVIHGAESISSQVSENDTIRFVQYTPTHIEILSNTESEAYLILNDAFYRGWLATVNGEETPIYRANVMFRALRVPSGESTVIFDFVPTLWYRSMMFGAVMWLIAIVTGIILFRRQRRESRAR